MLSPFEQEHFQDQKVDIGGLRPPLPILEEQDIVNEHILREKIMWIGNYTISFSVGTFMSAKKHALLIDKGTYTMNADTYKFSSQEIVLSDGEKQWIGIVADGADDTGDGIGFRASTSAVNMILNNYIHHSAQRLSEKRETKDILVEVIKQANTYLYIHKTSYDDEGKESPINRGTAASVYSGAKK